MVRGRIKSDRRVLGLCERDYQAKRRVLWRKVDEEEDKQEVPEQDKPLYGMRHLTLEIPTCDC